MTDHEHDSIEDIGCLEAINHLYAYLDGEITDPRDIALIEHHLGHCRSCYSRIELERTLTRRLRATKDATVPAEVRNRLQDIMKKF